MQKRKRQIDKYFQNTKFSSFFRTLTHEKPAQKNFLSKQKI